MELVGPKADAPNGEWDDLLETEMDPCLDRTAGSLPSSEACNDPCRNKDPRLDKGLIS